MSEILININGQMLPWRDNFMARVTWAKMLDIKKPEEIFGKIRGGIKDPKEMALALGALIAGGVTYQPDETGHWRDIGITQMDAAMSVPGEPKEMIKIITQILDVVNGVNPTSAGTPLPAKLTEPMEPTEMNLAE